MKFYYQNLIPYFGLKKKKKEKEREKLHIFIYCDLYANVTFKGERKCVHCTRTVNINLVLLIDEKFLVQSVRKLWKNNNVRALAFLGDVKMIVSLLHRFIYLKQN